MTSADEFATYREIKSQTEAWSQALDVVHVSSLPKAGDYDQVLFTGCGSTYYLALAAAASYQELTGRAARAVPAGELLLNPRASVGRIGNPPRRDAIPPHELLVAVSRSGTTTETIKVVEKFKQEKRGEVVVISNNDEILSLLADVNLVISNGREISVAQTRSFASMYIAAIALCVRMAGRDDLLHAMNRLPDAGNRLIEKYESFAEELGRNLNFDRFYFLGSGIRYGLACETSLKMTEMTLTHSASFHFLEFRHGPMSMIDETTVVVGMLSDENRGHEAAVLSEMNMLGGTVTGLGEAGADVEFKSGIPDSVRGVLFLPVLQLMAFHRSLAKGLNPDRPKNLTAVVKLDL